MILEKRRGRWWVYLDPGSVAQDELVFGLCNKDQHSTNMILDWLAENVSGGWRASARVVHRKGDYRDFVAVTFSDYDDALMFFLAFEQQAPVVDLKEPDWKKWAPSAQSNPTAMTFEPWARGARCFEVGSKESKHSVSFCWSTSRNAAGNYLAWEMNARSIVPGSVRAFDKRKDAKEWAWTKSNNFGK